MLGTLEFTEKKNSKKLCIKTEYAIGMKHKTIYLLKNRIYSKNEAFHEYFTSSS